MCACPESFKTMATLQVCDHEQNSNAIVYLVTLTGLAPILTVVTVTIFRHGLNFARCIVACPLLQSISPWWNPTHYIPVQLIQLQN